MSFSTIFTLIPSLGFLIVRVINFLQAFEEISYLQRTKLPRLSHKKQLGRNLKIPQGGLHLQLLFYELAKFDGMRLKIEGALIIVEGLAKTCLENFTSKVRRTSYNFTSGENSRSSYLANY